MGSSKKSSTSTYDLAGLKEYRQPLVNQLPRLESSYQEMKQNPLIGQAQGYTSDVLAGKYLTPENNPYLMNYANAAMKQFQSGQNALMARAGRGNLSGGDTQKMMGEGMTSALVAPLAAAIQHRARVSGHGRNACTRHDTCGGCARGMAAAAADCGSVTRASQARPRPRRRRRRAWGNRSAPRGWRPSGC